MLTWRVEDRARHLKLEEARYKDMLERLLENSEHHMNMAYLEEEIGDLQGREHSRTQVTRIDYSAIKESTDSNPVTRWYNSLCSTNRDMLESRRVDLGDLCSYADLMIYFTRMQEELQKVYSMAYYANFHSTEYNSEKLNKNLFKQLNLASTECLYELIINKKDMFNSYPRIYSELRNSAKK